MSKNNTIFINGNILPDNQGFVKVLDQGLQFGWGLFETIRVYDGRPFLLNKHLERIFSSADKLNINITYTKDKIESQVLNFLKESEISSCVLKIIITKGENDRSNIIFTRRQILYTQEQYFTGFSAVVAAIRRNPTSPLVYMKTLNYMENILARQEAVKNGFDEALFLNTGEFLCEGSISNIFFIKDKTIYTPGKDNGILPGIIRQLVVGKLAIESGLESVEGSFTLEDLLDAEEAFLTNSVMEIMPLVRVGDRNIGNGKPGNKTMALWEKYKKLIKLP